MGASQVFITKIEIQMDGWLMKLNTMFVLYYFTDLEGAGVNQLKFEASIGLA
jgi:hypothetical protein